MPDILANELPTTLERKRTLVVECAVLVSLGFLPPMLRSLPDVFAHNAHEPHIEYFTSLRGVPSTLVNLAVIGAIVFTLWTAGELKILGLRFLARVDVLLIGVVTVLTLAPSVVTHMDYYASLPVGEVPVGGAIVGVAGIAISAAYQELLFRGYMLPRLSEIFESKWIGWGITTVLFGMWHLYQGTYGAISTFVFGAVMGLVVLFTNRVIAVIVVHTITNSFSLIVWLALMAKFQHGSF